jgi:CubicO group peptidase (beta-lactamase class C family)
VTTTTERPAIDQQHWQQRLEELAAKHLVPGAVLAVLRLGEGPGADGDELVEAATGVLNKSTGVEVTTDSVFQIGSISKVWTATLVMQLVDEGKLDLDAPIADVLPDLQVGDPEVARQVTMRHLLTHTSGIDGDIFTDTGRGDDVLEKYVASLADAPQNHPLGATFSYCNSGFSLAGRVVEVVTGKTWDAVLRERIIEPLGLTHTSTLPEEAILHRVAVGHITPDPDAESTPAPTWMLPRSLGPAGLINATARDVTSFARVHLRGGAGPDGTQLLSAGSTAAMQAHQADIPDTYSLGDSWGLGWIRFDWHGERLYGHDGTTFGQNAYLRVLPSAELAVALTTNGGHTADLFNDLYRELFAELAGVAVADQLEPPAEAPDVDLARYVGTYERSSVTTEVLERDGGLVARVIPTGEIAEASGATVEELELHPVRQGLFATRPHGYETWMAVVFYTLPNGAEYLHFGVRANPRKA